MITGKKKIIYIITKSVWGGAQRYVFDLATNLSRGEWDVFVVAGGDGLLMQKLKEKNIPVIQIKELERDINIFSEFKIFWKIFTILKNEQPDIVHLNSSKIGAVGSIAAWLYNLTTRSYKLKAKIVFTAHGWVWNEDRPYWQIFFITLVTKITALFQHRIIILSRRDLASAVYNKIPEKKLVVIPLGIQKPETSQAPLDAQKELAKLTGTINRPLLGTIAEFTKNKGLRYLIQALHRLHQQKLNFSCVLIGDGEEKDYIQKLITELKLENKIKLAGFTKDVARYLNAFDVFVLPSVKEGLPYVLLEATAAGLPIVATDVGGISDIIEHNKNGFLVPPKNPAALADSIKKLLNDGKLLQKFSQNTRQKSATFLFKDMLAKTISVYQEEV